jgi:hypothetical protein
VDFPSQWKVEDTGRVDGGSVKLLAQRLCKSTQVHLDLVGIVAASHQ